MEDGASYKRKQLYQAGSEWEEVEKSFPDPNCLDAYL